MIDVADKVPDGNSITIEEAESLFQATDSNIILLCACADKINGKSGNCPEDCTFCAQSAHHCTGVGCHPLLDEDEIVRLAIQREKAGARHCDIAISGLGYTGGKEKFQTILRAFRRMKKIRI